MVFSGFYTMFSILPLVVMIGFIIVFIIIIVTILKNIMIWNKNNHSLQLTVSATIVSKRILYRRRANANDITGMHGHQTISSYYITFEFESGDRMEFSVDSSEYGLLVEGDTGNLCFQGTRYLSFERHK